MRCAHMASVIGLILGFAAQSAFARGPLSIGEETPDKYDNIKSVLKEKIPDYLKESQCGGWQNKTAEGTVAEVTGLPGRKGVWNAAILSGMGVTDTNKNGKRDDDFKYPDTAKGLTTACALDTDKISKTVWVPKAGGYPDEIEQKNIEYPHPKFSDPTCRWRVKDQNSDDTKDQAPDIPLKPYNEYNPPLEYKETDDAQKRTDRQSPPNCINFCVYINTFQYGDCLQVVNAEIPDPADPSKTIVYPVCQKWGKRYICSDAKVDDDPMEALTMCTPGTPTTKNPSAKSCSGNFCRCEKDGKGICQTVKTISDGDKPYASYYREYAGGYARSAVQTDKNTDRSSNNVAVACYGMYHEFDPFHKQTVKEDRRCVMNIDVEGYRDSQKGKGEYGQNSNMPDQDVRNPNNTDFQRKGGQYDKEKDLWYQKFSGGFSLLNEKMFHGDFNFDLSMVYLDTDKLDNAEMTATTQLKDRTYAVSNTVRAFDDTGTGRILATWWQKQQNEMTALLHPPVVRMLLPSGWAFGADPDDPFFHQADVKILDEFDTHNDRIELQISADEDILGSAIAYIERSLLLHVIEEPVPVLVPMGSSTEFRAKAEAWCAWYMENNDAKNCDNAPAKVKDTVEKLEEYADSIDDIRTLRGELARYAGTILKLQQDLTAPISTWIQENIADYRSVLEERRNLRQTVGRQWRGVQEDMNKFHDETNMPWCMNQRFTSPVYSLLDEWLPSRKPNGVIAAYELPNLTIPPAKDIVVDFSTIAYMSGAITIPVLKPVQVRIANEIPWPPADPSLEKAEELLKDYPSVPSVENIKLYIRQTANNLPKVPEDQEKIPSLNLDKLGKQNMEEIQEQVRRMKDDVVKKMNERYEKFWKSIGPLKPGEGGEHKEKKEKLECMEWDDDLCQHVEMDLMERLTRIGSRPLVMLNEDYESKNIEKRFGGSCVDIDDVCTPAHPEEGTPRHQLEIIGPRTQLDFMENLRRSVRQETLPDPIGGLKEEQVPTYGVDPNELLPIHDIPPAIDLTPRASSSSAGS